ncbi:phosphotransferase family protein [Cellulomonas taurus]|uniref:phosphotransferase family protein n=1 Tax=Cellulomonas taurus TaxID=2729175 RepID=UPI00145DF19B|nr:phosphotransferase [Cellulomonas taurus]
MLDDETRTALLHALAPLGEVADLTPLTGGMFATSVRVDLADGRRLVAKTAPADDDRLLHYERDLLRTEALVYRIAGDDPALPMPELVLTDMSRAHLPGDLVVASWIDGVRADTVPELAEATAPLRNRDLGRMMAALHRHVGDQFGYPSGPDDLRGDSWVETFTAMVEALLTDAATWEVPLPVERIRAALHRHQGALAEVDRPALVHADLWPGNLFVHPESGALTGVIDPERAFWGDPMFDLIACDPLRVGAPDEHLLAGYRAAGGVIDPTSPRLALCRMYLALIMRIEVRPRRYEGDELPGYLAQLESWLDAALAELD